MRGSAEEATQSRLSGLCMLDEDTGPVSDRPHEMFAGSLVALGRRCQRQTSNVLRESIVDKGLVLVSHSPSAKLIAF